MQVIFNANMSNNQTNFQSLKKVNGIKTLESLIGEEGNSIGNEIVTNLKANDAFKELCEKFDVFVDIIPKIQPEGIMLKKGLSLKIFAQKIDKTLFGLFKKKEKIPVASFMPFGLETPIWKLAEYMNNKYILVKDGLEKDICDFLKDIA